MKAVTETSSSSSFDHCSSVSAALVAAILENDDDVDDVLCPEYWRMFSAHSRHI